MVERSRLRLLAGLAGLPVAAGASANEAAGDGDLLAIMRRVLDNDVEGALASARRLAAETGRAAAAQLATELTDMARGNYATEGNRAFARLAPLWRRARSLWLAEREPPADRWPSSVLSLAPGVAQVLAVDLEVSAAWLLPGPAAGNAPLASFYISSGVDGPAKRRRGDRRTPVGVYWVVDELDTARLPARYGSRVLPLDYPNALDRWMRRSGDGIWIHGIDPANNVRPPRDTDGCIAVTEDRVHALADGVAQRVTPVVIGTGLEWRGPGERDTRRAALDAALSTWLGRRRERDAAGFLALYADGFTRLGMAPPRWRGWRRRMLESGAAEDVTLDEVSHFVADAEAGVYLTRCRQTLVGGGAPVSTWLRLYWQEQKGRLRIVAQSTG